MFTVNKNPSPRDLKWFAAGMLLVAVVFASWLVWHYVRDDKVNWSAWVLAGAMLSLVALSAGLAALLSQAAGRNLYVAWMTVTLPVGIFLSTVLLTLMYFLILPIFSLIVRMQDPLRKKPGGSSYWEDYRREEPTLERMRRPF